MLRSIGADFVIDFTREDFTTTGEKYDVIFDVVGKAPFSGCMRSLKEEGIYLLGSLNLSKWILMKWTSIRSRKKLTAKTADYGTEDLVYLKDLIESGTLKIIIDRIFRLEEMVEAHRYVEAGGKKGNVVITMEYM
jgi:NADPH:quinone reductase-like Zn-dependent oxidoreductase